MKISVKTISAAVLFVCLSQLSFAQYKHGIGGVAGSMNGFSYKTVITGNFAISVDLGVKLCVGAFDNINIRVFDVEVNPDFMYQANAAGGLYWFVGGGFGLGYAFNDFWRYGYGGEVLGKFGINAIGGLEYKFNIPLALQFDFRPGFGMIFGNHVTEPYFDWGLNLSLRYAF
ncbi:MAG: hypothetical protein J5701_01680 [Bacteroidales bacterium]|nr:hypothetical protein [Bacteroidales bacterium]